MLKRCASIRGPSPRAWGERGHLLPSLFLGRTIPTRVGRTSASAALASVSTDHPHARGENFVAIRADSHQSGPSPRAWGELARAKTFFP